MTTQHSNDRAIRRVLTEEEREAIRDLRAGTTFTTKVDEERAARSMLAEFHYSAQNGADEGYLTLCFYALMDSGGGAKAVATARDLLATWEGAMADVVTTCGLRDDLVFIHLQRVFVNEAGTYLDSAQAAEEGVEATLEEIHIGWRDIACWRGWLARALADDPTA